jgi:hypothetical protein
MGVAAKAFDFKIRVPGIECVPECRGRLCGSLKAEHALIPSLARQPVGSLAASAACSAAARTDAP